jgi:hypothetical protein
MNATFKSVFEGAFSSSSCMHLGFDDELVCSKGSGYFFRFFRCGGDATWTVGDTEFIEEFFGLVFVDIHLAILSPLF